ncbi:MAG: family 1 glycosylhydrolase [Armatimonadota bacterium]|nr:family 1 glycosylhydrolase [Armatimonadota bacterium]MDR7485807.1 family 1 glycosylhydrolase [Armatimonadota bacterium]MDR7532104.1 family 1 glycosylhydrolase [Armatimonadota bacterium]MDR7536693.1 family 1 glycosylhydrolase [Armatimonadota bacterium]
MAATFPQGFRWGVATSAYQFEGDNTAADWWAWEARGRIRDGSRSGRACDWWRAAERDFDLIAGLNLNAVRLSLEWSRLEPAPGGWDDAAMDRYLEMLRGLRDRGLEPMVTLNHFTLPQWVAARGGWAWRGIVGAFAGFTARVVHAAGQLVTRWITLNEPMGYLLSGYLLGQFPPGRANPVAFVRALRHSLQAHAAAYRAVHAAQADAQVGLAAYLRPVEPARGRGLEAALAARLDYALNWLYLDAVRSGDLAGPGGLRLRIDGGAGTLDFLGINYYTRTRVRLDPLRPHTLFVRAGPPGSAALSDRGFAEVHPDGLLAVLRRARGYGVPLYVTENGLPDANDRLRPRFIIEHVRRVAHAIAEGCPVRGYYHWSIVDNFEWNDGWSLRFGLYALDERTQARAPRPSAALYAAIAKANALPAHEHGGP